MGSVRLGAVRPLLLAAGALALSLSPPMPSWAKSQPLAGTTWQLREIQSMDDAQGTTPIPDPSRFTLRLEADGTARLRLDCNRATGTWTAEPSADPGNGSLRFGPLAATRALCPPPQRDQQVLSQLSFVRGYLLQDGRLYLSLLADGGILVWDPRDAALETAIRQASPGYRTDVVAAGGSQRPSRYAYARVDLNDDGSDETLVYLMGPFFCGTGGCTLQVFAADSDPSGGGMPATYVRHSFDGNTYVEQERRPADQRPEGTVVLSESLTFDDGLVLEPAP